MASFQELEPNIPGSIIEDGDSIQEPLFVMDWRSIIPKPMVDKIDKKISQVKKSEENGCKADENQDDNNSFPDHEKDEETEKELRKMRKEMARMFIQKTTLHGLSYMSDSDHSVRRRSFWTIMVIIMFTCFIISSWMHFLEYTRHPVKSVISVEQSTSATFPAITFCNLNPIRVSFLEAEISNPLNRSHLRLFPRHRLGLFRLDGSVNEASMTADKLRGVNATLYAEEGAHKLEDMLISCNWKHTECSLEDFTMRWTNYGYCFTFNEPHRDDVQMAGRHERFAVTLNVQQNEYSMEGLESAAGYVVMLHEQGDVPLIYDFGFLAPPGYLTQVAIKKKVRETLEAPYPSKCRKKAESFYSGEYTINKCMASYEMERVISHCQCIMPYMPKTGNYELCDAYQVLECFTQLVEPPDPCDRPCHEVIYEKSISMAQAPSQKASINIEKKINMNFSQQLANLVQISFFFEDINVEMTTEVEAYDFKDLTGGVGGELGLFLGASIITIAEFVDFVIVAKYYECRSLRKKFLETKARNKADTSNIFPWWLRMFDVRTWIETPNKSTETTNDRADDVHESAVTNSCVWTVEPANCAT